MTTTETWKSTNLGKILTRKQLDKVVGLVNKAQRQDDLVKELKVYYRSISDHLERQGVLPDYLAYYTAYIVMSVVDRKNRP